MNAITESDWRWAKGIVKGSARKRQKVSDRFATFEPCEEPTFAGLILAAMMAAQADNDFDEFRRLCSTFPQCKRVMVENQRREADESAYNVKNPEDREPGLRPTESPRVPQGCPTSDDRPESASDVADSENVPQRPANEDPRVKA